MRRVITSTLKSAGFDVVEACDGVEGLKQARQHKCDLILSDVNRPNRDGIAMSKALRSLPNHNYTPTLMRTTESGLDKQAEGKMPARQAGS